jgi:hypothetical protein
MDTKLRLQLERLDAQFPKKEVLFSEDLVAILGVDERAQTNLRARGEFPFAYKKIGRRVCVEKIQVAEWLITPPTPNATPRPLEATQAVQSGKNGWRSRKPARLPSRSPLSRFAEQAQLNAQFAVEVEAQAFGLGVDLLQRFEDETDEDFHKWVVKMLKYGSLAEFLDSLVQNYNRDYATDVAHKILETKLCAPGHKKIAKRWLDSFPQ